MNAKQTETLKQLTTFRPWIICGKEVYPSIGIHPSAIRSLVKAGIISKLHHPIYKPYYYINAK